MPDIVIRVENLSKRYRIGRRHPPGSGGRNLLRSLASPFGYLSSSLRPPKEDEILWALKDLSFDVKQGEVLGVIGRNGAGKSTLLKILSRITEPSSGRAVLDGRVGSLLEVGTGFHPELTGRENIFLSGAILGMKRGEIVRKFDEILAFAEIEKFLDTPVKRYSSGMYVRLAFAVAAHLEPEILLVDEVLAVGDTEFQRKCLGKIESVANEGRTVLLVSHSMSAVQNLCHRVLVFNYGTLDYDGSTDLGVDYYLRIGRPPTTHAIVDLANWSDRRGDGLARIEQIRFETTDGRLTREFQMGEAIRIKMVVRYLRRIQAPECGIAILTNRHEPLFTTNLSDTLPLVNAEDGLIEYTAILDPCPLKPGQYLIAAAVTRGYVDAFDLVDNVPGFRILDAKKSEDMISDARWGYFYFRYPWERQSLGDQ